MWPGWKSSEFWITASLLLTLFVSACLFFSERSSVDLAAATAFKAAGFVMLGYASWQAVVNYQTSRHNQKMALLGPVEETEKEAQQRRGHYGFAGFHTNVGQNEIQE